MKTKIGSTTKEILDSAQKYANKSSGCLKVAVGCVIILRDSDRFHIYGCNKSMPLNCRTFGCRRVELYGEDSKEHRLPSDCRALHAEIAALTQAAWFGQPTYGATMYVTRYPCEACARAIVNAGIKHVYYGREQEISEETQKIFHEGHVKVTHVDNWYYADTRR